MGVVTLNRPQNKHMKTTTKAQEKSIARIFEDVGGYYICDESSEYLDARGCSYPTKSSAMRAAYDAGYSHACGSGTYKGNKLTKLP